MQGKQPSIATTSFRLLATTLVAYRGALPIIQFSRNSLVQSSQHTSHSLNSTPQLQIQPPLAQWHNPTTPSQPLQHHGPPTSMSTAVPRSSQSPPPLPSRRIPHSPLIHPPIPPPQPQHHRRNGKTTRRAREVPRRIPLRGLRRPPDPLRDDLRHARAAVVQRRRVGHRRDCGDVAGDPGGEGRGNGEGAFNSFASADRTRRMEG